MRARRGKFALDTNVVIDALRDAEAGLAWERFQNEFAPFLYLSAVVAHELRAGARLTDRKRLEKLIFAPFERRGRVFTPGYAAWSGASEVLWELGVRDHTRAVPRSFANDVLIALSCREAGITLVTSNTRDFARIAEISPVDFVPPWPIAPR